MCLDIFHNRKVYKLSGVARRRKGGGGHNFFQKSEKQNLKKKVVAKRSSISYYGRGDAQCIIHSFELLCKRNL